MIEVEIWKEENVRLREVKRTCMDYLQCRTVGARWMDCIWKCITESQIKNLWIVVYWLYSRRVYYDTRLCLRQRVCFAIFFIPMAVSRNPLENRSICWCFYGSPFVEVHDKKKRGYFGVCRLSIPWWEKGMALTETFSSMISETVVKVSFD